MNAREGSEGCLKAEEGWLLDQCLQEDFLAQAHHPVLRASPISWPLPHYPSSYWDAWSGEGCGLWRDWLWEEGKEKPLS